jgi:hypothetical protein
MPSQVHLAGMLLKTVWRLVEHFVVPGDLWQNARSINLFCLYCKRVGQNLYFLFCSKQVNVIVPNILDHSRHFVHL